MFLSGLLDQILEKLRRYPRMQVGTCMYSTAGEQMVVWTECNKYGSLGYASPDDACSNNLGRHVLDIHCAYLLHVYEVHEYIQNGGPSLAIIMFVL